MADTSASGPTGPDTAERPPSENWKGVKRDAQGIADAAAEEARKLGDTARREASTFAERRKNTVAQSVADIAGSVRETGDGFADKPNIQAFTRAAADGLDDLAEQISRKSFGELYSDAERFARRRPVAVAAGAAAVGLLAARFLKSSAKHARDYENRQDEDEDGVGGFRGGGAGERY